MQKRPQARTLTSHHNLEGGPYTSVRQLTQLRYAAREIDLIAMSKAINPLSGLLSSNFRGRGIDFAEVRVYQPGDDVRTIDWRVTARTQKPHTKLFQEEKERPVFLVVDQSESMFFGSRITFKSVIAAQAAALMAWTALEGGDRVGGLVFSNTGHREVRPRRTKHSVLRLLQEVNQFNQRLGKSTSGTEPRASARPHSAGHLLNERVEHPFDESAIGAESKSPVTQTSSVDKNGYLSNALGKIRQVAKHGSTIFLISDFMDFNAETQRHLNQLARHNDIVGIHISDDMERSLPPPDQYTITNGIDRTRINTANRSHRDKYQQHFAEHLQSLRSEFTRFKAPFFELMTHESVINSLSNQYSKYAHTVRTMKHR
jgi:uncharacterized protein (DUF58 family)